MRRPATIDGVPSPPWPGARCADPDLPSTLWFSDDPVEQSLARAECLLCPLAVPCRRFGRREAAGIWGGLSREQRDLAGLTLPEPTFCTVCDAQLPDGHPSTICGPVCYRARSISARKQTRAEISASRACERCGCSLWPQSRSCLICDHIVGDPIPNRPWPPAARLVTA